MSDLYKEAMEAASSSTEPTFREAGAFERGYLAGAEPREKRIAELEALVPRWVLMLSAQESELISRGWSIANRFSARDFVGNPLHLMIPPIPPPVPSA